MPYEEARLDFDYNDRIGDNFFNIDLTQLKASLFFELPYRKQEKYVLDILGEIAKQSDQVLLFENQTSRHLPTADAFAPYGILNYISPISIYIVARRFTSERSFSEFWHLRLRNIQRRSNKDSQNSEILIIVVNNEGLNLSRLEKSIRELIAEKVHIVSLAQLLNRSLPQSLNYILLKNYTEDIDIDNVYKNFLSIRSEANLKRAFRDERLTLFLGAGASVDAGLPDWNSLVDGLWIDHLDKILPSIKISSKKLDKELENAFGTSPTIRARILRSQLGDKIYGLIKDRIYANAPVESELLSAISYLASPPRDSMGLQAVFTFNYDDLVERYLDKLGVRYKSIVHESENHTSEELPIYHIHGFMDSSVKSITALEASSIVFTEDSYHHQIQDIYSWNNLTMLNHFRYNTCLFIGCSLVDPNLRRLLEFNAKKSPNNKHYAILKAPSINGISSEEKILRINLMKMQVSTLNELGIEIIWMPDYVSIPVFLRTLR